jgi:hypothetical protein
MYIPHPSEELNNLFRERPYQGVPPENASFLFIGLDANYAENISSQSVFPKVLEYHHDGIGFWQSHNVHHPFLLSEYKGGGRNYHISFAKIGFLTSHAALVSFVELLDIPTVGRSKLEPSDLNIQHLKSLNSAILDGQAKYIFIPFTVARLMRKSGIFPWLKSKPIVIPGSLNILYQHHNKTVYSHLHFSVYGKSYERKVMEATLINSLLQK